MAFFQQFDPVASLRCSYNNRDDYRKDCLYNLQIQLLVVFGSMIVVNNTLELLLPFCKNSRKIKKSEELSINSSHQSAENHFDHISEQYLLESYDGVLSDYEELAIQFGYVVLFVLALPLVPLLALGNNVLETRVDSLKIMELLRRTLPRGAADIGSWSGVFIVMGIIAIATNTALAVFAYQEIDNLVSGDTRYKIWIFVAAEVSILQLILFSNFHSTLFFSHEYSFNISSPMYQLQSLSILPGNITSHALINLTSLLFLVKDMLLKY